MRPTRSWALSPTDLLGEQALKQGERLQGLPQIVARRREKARLGDGRQFRLSLGGGQRIRRAPPFRHVLISDNHALGLLVRWRDRARSDV